MNLQLELIILSNYETFINWNRSKRKRNSKGTTNVTGCLPVYNVYMFSALLHLCGIGQNNLCKEALKNNMPKLSWILNRFSSKTFIFSSYLYYIAQTLLKLSEEVFYIIILSSTYLIRNTKYWLYIWCLFWNPQVLCWYDHWMKTRKLSSRNLFKSTLKGICCTYGHIIMNQSQVNYHIHGWYYHLSMIFCSRYKLDYYHTYNGELLSLQFISALWII